jgi:hypothetical protein
MASQYNPQRAMGEEGDYPQPSIAGAILASYITHAS